MRTLEREEIESVSGGFEMTVDIGVTSVTFTGADFNYAYDWAVDQMTSFFNWWDPAGYYQTS